MVDEARKQGSSNFAVACSLLSQFIKEKGSAADLGLGIAQVAPKGKSEPFQLPVTMSLLPGADVSGGQDSEGEVFSQENPMDLFPQSPGLLTSASQDSRVAQKSQLTIVYGGKVLVLDNFPAEKAKDLMQLASRGSSMADNLVHVAPSPLAEAVTSSRSFSYKKNSTLVPKAAASNPVAPQVNLSKPAHPNLSDLPIARKVSLQRFLEKRKDRIHARAPYQMTPSPQVATSIIQEDIKSWLGLGHHFATPALSLSSDYRR